MTDKLKIFVISHRQEFDSVDFPADMWRKIDNDLKLKNDHWIKSNWVARLFYLGCISAGVALMYFFSQKTNQMSSTGNEHENIIKLAVEDTSRSGAHHVDEPNKNERQFMQKNVTGNSALISDTYKLDPDRETDIDLPEYKEITAHSNPGIVATTKKDSAYVFPTLTETEIKANNKQKKKMLEQMLKLSKAKYSLIHGKSGSSAGGFYMQNAEVTNLEYRTFLFDLLIRNKKDEFLIAKPVQSLWINSNGSHTFDNFKEDYFSNKELNEYPVVNISLEGAKLYCAWFNELITANGNLEKENPQISMIRLPGESEWVYSAMGGSENAAYPWGTDSIQNSKKCFLANFCCQKLKSKFRQPYGYTAKTNLNAYTSAGLVTNNDTMATALVYSYNRNNYDLYCMSGNVSEWVVSDDSKTGKAIGGNWGSDFEHLKINSESEFRSQVTASPFIGFRPLIRIKR
ncbi:MAG: formylglycine-generating enzyme family protein [Bacteroidia bacterium]